MLIRYFAAASAATGIEEETLDVPSAVSLGDLERILAERHPGSLSGRRALSDVLTRCSFLLNGVATTDRSTPLASTDSLDVLPPFAGG
jgi:molybdopterin synthase sulfur carrier subunit